MKNLRKNLRKSYEKLMTTKCLTYDKYCDEMTHLYNNTRDFGHENNETEKLSRK